MSRLRLYRWTRALAAGTALALLGACAGTPVALPARPIVLFGEVHDNAAQHRLRLGVIESMLRAGARPALLFEQFDRERQGEIDRVRAALPAPDVEALIAAGSGAASSKPSGWDWPLYRPLIALALEHDLPIVAANVSRADTRRILAEGLEARGFEPTVAPDITAAQATAIEQSHCGMVDAAQARRMTSAQVARDQFMARLVETHASRGAVLIAGNGHVRNDLGVPRWLTPATRALTETIGMLEADAGQRPDDTGAYDRVILTARQPRPDPCASMR